MAHKNQQNISPMRPRSGGQRGRHRPPEKIYSFNEADDRIYDIFRNHDFADVPHEVRHQLVRFYEILMSQQTTENFTRLTSLRDVAIKHFIDCLMIPRLTKLQFPLLDVGTGPGFPGIPLKIVYPKQRILLGEGVQKRVEFLKKVREHLKLKNLDIIGRNIGPDFHLPVKGVITRAVEDVRNTLGNVMSCLDVGGRVYFMKGPKVDPEIELAGSVWGEFYRLAEDRTYVLPHTPHDRRLVIYEKIKHKPLTDEEFDAYNDFDEEGS